MMSKKQGQKDTRLQSQQQNRRLQTAHMPPTSQLDLVHFDDAPAQNPNYDNSGHENSQHYNERREPPLRDPVIEDVTSDDGFGESADSATSELGTHLLFCAQAIEKNNGELGAYADALRNAIANRLASEARLTAQSLRLAIGTIWLMIAFLLYMNVNQRGKNGIFSNGLGSQMPIEHASSLSSLFLIASLPVIILAVVTAIYIWHSTGNNTRIRHAAENLGLHIAATAHQFDDTLNGFLKNSGHGQNSGDTNLSNTVQDLSRAHLTALEVQLFFRRLKFMNAKTRRQAIADLQSFLKNTSSSGISPTMTFLVGIIIGIVSAIIFFAISFSSSSW